MFVRSYVKLYIPGVPYVHKTSPPQDQHSDDPTQRNPVWQQTFEFPILREELRDRLIVLKLLSLSAPVLLWTAF